MSMKMKGARFFFKSIGFRIVRPAVYAWFFNFIFSLLIYLGCWRVFSHAAGRSVIAGDVYGQVGVFTFLADIFRNYRGNLSLVLFFALLTVVLFVLVSIYVSGGIYSVLVEDERSTFANLVVSSTENFYGMLKIFLFSLPVWGVALAIPALLFFLFSGCELLVLNESLVSIFTYLWIGITALLLVFSTAIYDFARIVKLKEDRSLLQTIKKTFRFTFSNKRNILVIFVLYALSLVLLFLVYAVFAGLVEPLLYISFIFAIYQGFIMVRYYLRVMVIQAEIKLIGHGG